MCESDNEKNMDYVILQKLNKLTDFISFQSLRTDYGKLRQKVEENKTIIEDLSRNNMLQLEKLQIFRMDENQMEMKFIENLRSIDDLLKRLIDDGNRWKNFHNEIQRLECLFEEIGSMFDANMFGERALEEKEQIIEVRRGFFSVPFFVRSRSAFIFSEFETNWANIFIRFQFCRVKVEIFNRFHFDRKNFARCSIDA